MGSANELVELIENIKKMDFKGDFSKLNSTNPYVKEQWLEALDLIMWMTQKRHEDRPSHDQVLNDILFLPTESKKNVLVKASEILHDSGTKDRANQFVITKILPMIIVVQ
jgi:hypothetical protein